jgi:hypothetical protein
MVLNKMATTIKVRRKLRLPIDIEKIKTCFLWIDIDSITFKHIQHATDYVNKTYKNNKPTISILTEEMNDGATMLGYENAVVLAKNILDEDKLHKLGYHIDNVSPFHFVVWRI